MRLIAAAFALVCCGYLTQAPVVKASVYDSNVIHYLQLTDVQKAEMEKVISESRARRNHIFKRYGIDPNANPKMSLLMRASSELKANLARERAAAKKILTPKQLRIYDAVIKQTRRRVTSSF
jgi:hypothetical protein